MRKYLIILILALIGVANAWYLTYETLEIFRAQTAGGPLGALPCDISSSLSCSGILSNPRAIIFTINGFKVAFPMIAAFVYPLLALIALCGYIRKSLTEAKILSALAFGGMCFNGYVISQEFIVGVFCPLCAICTAIIITIFILSMSLWKSKSLT